MSNLVLPIPLGGKVQNHGALWNWKIDESAGGKETRSTYWLTPRYHYTVTATALSRVATRKDYQQIRSFWQRHGGPGDSFLLLDTEDNAVTAHNTGVGDGSSTDYQLQRTLVADADLVAPLLRSYWPGLSDGYEPVTELSGNPSIFVDTGSGPVLKTLATDYTLPGQGVVSFLVPPASGALITWTGSYYVRVRFANPEISFERIVTAMWSTGLDLISSKNVGSLIVPSQFKPRTDFSGNGTLTGSITGTTGSDGNPTFGLSHFPASGYPVNVFKNGFRLSDLAGDYTVVGQVLTMNAPNIPVAASGAAPADTLLVDYYSVV